jgi:imidazolonepropionase-like amidohydrolase
MKPLDSVLLILAPLFVCVPAHAEDLQIRAAKVYTMAGPPLSPGAVLITNGKIAKLGESLTPPTGTKVIDLGSGVLVPGLVDAYSHAAIAVSPSEITREVTPAYRVLTAVDWRSRSFREAVAEGTTCLGIAPGTDGVFAGLSCAVKSAGEAAARRVIQRETGLVITMASDPGNGNSARNRPDSIYTRQPTNRMGVVWILRATFDKAGRERVPETALEKAKLDTASNLAVVREALAGQRRVYAVSRTEHDMLALLRVAKEFKFTPTVIGGHEAYKIRAELASAKVPVILAPLTTNPSVVGPESSEVIWNQPGLLHKAGVTFALSGGNLLEQARFAVRNGLAPDVALQAITTTPARLLGLEDRVGTLAVGRDADVVALDGDPLELTTSIQWVLVDGTIYEKGN